MCILGTVLKALLREKIVLVRPAREKRKGIEIERIQFVLDKRE